MNPPCLEIGIPFADAFNRLRVVPALFFEPGAQHRIEGCGNVLPCRTA